MAKSFYVSSKAVYGFIHGFGVLTKRAYNLQCVQTNTYYIVSYLATFGTSSYSYVAIRD